MSVSPTISLTLEEQLVKALDSSQAIRLLEAKLDKVLCLLQGQVAPSDCCILPVSVNTPSTHATNLRATPSELFDIATVASEESDTSVGSFIPVELNGVSHLCQVATQLAASPVENPLR